MTTLFLADRFLKTNFVATLRGIVPELDAALPGPALPDLRRVVVLGGDVPQGAVGFDAFMAGTSGPRGAAHAPSCAPDDVLLIQYTSGTTSFPKGVMLTHASMLANAYVSGGRIGFRIGDRYHSARPFFHVSGSTLSVLSAVQHMVTLVTMDRFEPAEALRLMEAEGCTHFSGNDTMALMLLNHPSRPARRLRLRGAWVAASPAILRRVIDDLGARECVAGYGLSEASPNIAQSCWWEPESIRIGGRMRPQPGVEVRILGPDEADCPPGQPGEITVRGWNVMRGYYGKPQETASALDAEGWLHTGDLGQQVPMTEVLALAGRVASLGWHLQIHLDPALLPDLAPALLRSPAPVVIDHMARISADPGQHHPSFAYLCRLLDTGRCWVKVSGADRASLQGPPYADAVPMARCLVADYPDHVLWGTDWPHPNHAGPVPDDGKLVDLLAEIAPTPAARQALLVDNPQRLYRFTG